VAGNQLLLQNFCDVALRDFVLSLDALALARLSQEIADVRPLGFYPLTELTKLEA